MRLCCCFITDSCLKTNITLFHLKIDIGLILNPTPVSRYNRLDDLLKNQVENVKKPFYNPYNELAKKKADGVKKLSKPAKATKSVGVMDQFIDVGNIIADTLSDLASDSNVANTLTDLANENVGKVNEKEKEQDTLSDTDED